MTDWESDSLTNVNHLNTQFMEDLWEDIQICQVEDQYI